MKTLADRFRRWFEHERDCNLKMIEMLRSIPETRRGEPDFVKALSKTSHLATAREMWLVRLGGSDGPMPKWDAPSTPLEELPARFERLERAWSAYLAQLDEAELERVLQWSRADGQTWRWNVEGVLTQVNGHAWYHRGQIASLVAGLGGKAVDTDYIFWAKPEKIA